MEGSYEKCDAKNSADSENEIKMLYKMCFMYFVFVRTFKRSSIRSRRKKTIKNKTVLTISVSRITTFFRKNKRQWEKERKIAKKIQSVMCWTINSWLIGIKVVCIVRGVGWNRSVCFILLCSHKTEREKQREINKTDHNAQCLVAHNENCDRNEREKHERTNYAMFIGV